MRQAYLFKGKARDLQATINQWIVEDILEKQQKSGQHFLVAEFKLKQPGRPWEQTPIFECVDSLVDNMDTARDFFYKYAQHLATLHGVEVRWSFIGMGQGHYTSPKIDYATPLELLY